MWERLHRFNALDGQAQGLFVRAAILLLLVRFSLRLRGFGATHRMLERFRAHSQTRPKNVRNCVETTLRMVRAASRHGFVSASCLEESLVLRWLLARQGVESTLRIGIRREGEFAAHAWVEHDGGALNETESPHRHYAAFEVGFPRQPSRLE